MTFDLLLHVRCAGGGLLSLCFCLLPLLINELFDLIELCG